MCVFGAPVLSRLPFLRRHLAYCGYLPATKQAMETALQYRYPHNVALTTTGGIQEMFYAKREVLDKTVWEKTPQLVDRVILSRRKGFLKLCMRAGASVLPVYGFGNNDTYCMIFGPKSLAAKVSNFLNTSLVLWLGAPFGVVPCSPFPQRGPMLIVVGEEFVVEKNENPTDAELDALHEKYVEVYRKLYENWKAEYVKMGGDESYLRTVLKMEDEQ